MCIVGLKELKEERMNHYSARAREVARYALQHLLQRLTNREIEQQTISYAELSNLINEDLTNGRTSARSISTSLGFIRDHICQCSRRYPLINLLVVKADTRLCGEKALETCSDINEGTERQHVLQHNHRQFWQELFDATTSEVDWERYLETLESDRS
jgi:hypothetical protein